MVLLVRCHNGICTLALESHLDDLINDNLISSVLRKGEWVSAGMQPDEEVYFSPATSGISPIQTGQASPETR